MVCRPERRALRESEPRALEQVLVSKKPDAYSCHSMSPYRRACCCERSARAQSGARAVPSTATRRSAAETQPDRRRKLDRFGCRLEGVGLDAPRQAGPRRARADSTREAGCARKPRALLIARSCCPDSESASARPPACPGVSGLERQERVDVRKNARRIVPAQPLDLQLPQLTMARVASAHLSQVTSSLDCSG